MINTSQFGSLLMRMFANNEAKHTNDEISSGETSQVVEIRKINHQYCTLGPKYITPRE